jgi:superfamily II DNA helicase RecQ
MDSSTPARTNNPNTCHNTSVPHDPSTPVLPPSSALLRTWSERVVGASLDVWSMFPTQMQIDAVISLIDVDVCGGKVLLIVKTGAGKSHVMRTTGVMIGGVCLIIMPLLALGADQVSKLGSASQAFGSVEYFHLDEYRTQPENMMSVLHRVSSLPCNTRSTIFLFCSPQIIQNDARVKNCLLEAHSKLILKSVFLDEVHLYVEHGSSFRDDISNLKETFFSKLFPANNRLVHPSFCAMSATFTKKHQNNLHKLIGFSMPPRGIRWALADDFCRREIDIRFSVSDDFTSSGLTPFFKDIVVVSDASIKGIVYCNSVKDAINQLKKINGMLDNAVDFVGDAIIIHGQQNKIEKFINTKVFLGQVDKSSLTPVILVATSAANCGIDDPCNKLFPT